MRTGIEHKEVNRSILELTSKRKANSQAIEAVASGLIELVSAAWWGFDEHNATEAMQKAINSGAKMIIVPNMGRSWKVDPIYLESNQEIIFENGTVVIACKSSFFGKYDSLFTAANKENITLKGYGATFEMHKENYKKPPYIKAEWRHGITLLGCRNVQILGLTITKTGGDGIYIGRGSGAAGRKYCEDIYIRDVVLDDNYRQGISVVSGHNVVIENTEMINTKGTAPQAGIDFETNNPDERLNNCIVRNSVIRNNKGAGILIHLKNLDEESEYVSISIESCGIYKNMVAIWISGLSNRPRGEINFTNNELCGIKFVQKSSTLNVFFDE